MARKSRKKQIGQEAPHEPVMEAVPEERLAAAAYIRLSVENGGHDDGDTIETQIRLVHDFIKDNAKLKLADTYVDNGYTGTDFHRPEFERMMNDVKTGRIQCIVVKDLSRFGRDYLETGYYVETIFPKLNIRFIAVTDNFDNSREEDVRSLEAPIKNIVNGMYAKDISRKVKAAYELKRRRGDPPTVYMSYGYKYTEDRSGYLVDEDTAGNVRMIFQWMIMGLSLNQISDRLYLLQIPRPQDKRLGKDLSKNPGENGKWSYSTLRGMLMNSVYAGDYVAGKKVSSQYTGKERHDAPEDEWVVYRDHHEAVVLRSDFDEVQEMFKRSKMEYEKRNPGGAANRPESVFKGITYCGCCGKPMHFRNTKHRVFSDDDGGHTIAVCITPKGISDCPCRSVEEKLLRILVMDQIHLFIKETCDRGEMVRRLMNEKGDDNKAVSLKKKIASLNYRAKQAEQKKISLYSDYVEGILEKEDYQEIKEHYIAEKQECERKAGEAAQVLMHLEKKASAFDRQVRHLEQYLDSRAFDGSLVKELVEAVIIGTDDTIEVRFKCSDAYREWSECWEEGDIDG